MEEKSLIAGAISIILMVIMVTMVFVPILTETTTVEESNGTGNAIMIKDGDYGTIEITEAQALDITVNGGTTITKTGQYLPLYGLNMRVNHNANASTMSISAMVSGTSTTITNVLAISWTASEGDIAVTYTVGETDTTITIKNQYQFASADSGDYVYKLKSATPTVKYSDKSPFFISLEAGSMIMNDKVIGATGTVEIENTVVSGSADIYSMQYKSDNPAITVGGESVSNNIYLICSADVYGRTTGLSGPIVAMIDIIPLLLVVAVILATVGMIAYNRMS